MDKKVLAANALAEKAGVNVNTLASYQLPAASFAEKQAEMHRRTRRLLAIKKSTVGSL